MVGKFKGKLVGLRTYDKDGAPRFIYDVFCVGARKDAQTGLFTDECKVVSVIEDEQVLPNPKYGQEVEFFGEAMQGKNGMFIKCTCISEAVG